MSRRIVVVGGGLSALRASEQLRAAGWTEDIVVVGSETHPPYNRPPLTKAVLTGTAEADTLPFRQRPSTADVQWRLGTTATSADLGARTVTLDEASTLSYDGLVVATGVASRRLPLDAPVAWRHAIRTLEDSVALREELVPGTRVVVIGGGFIGCEVAAAARARDCEVTVVEPLGRPLAGPVGELVGAEVQRRHEEHGVHFRLGRTVAALEGTDRGPETVVLDDGERLAADVVVEAVGTVPNTGWLQGQGLDLANGVLCDSGLHPLTAAGPLRELVALGDVARFPVPMFGDRAFRIEHWSVPGDTAGHAARSLVAALDDTAQPSPAFDPVPSFWSDQYGTRIQSFGIPSLGLDDVRVLEGELDREAVVGFHKDGRLVGLVLFGMARRMVEYRTRLVEATAAGPSPVLAEGTVR